MEVNACMWGRECKCQLVGEWRLVPVGERVGMDACW